MNQAWGILGSRAQNSEKRRFHHGAGYNFYMAEFRFYHPIEVRYGDLDPQGHLNNAKYLTYMEQARINYLKELGLWAGGSFLDVGIILAEAQVTFLAPVQFGSPLRVGVRVTRLGNKSLGMEYQIEDGDSGRQFARGATALVAYDYHAGRSIPLPEGWREKIQTFEGLTEENSKRSDA